MTAEFHSFKARVFSARLLPEHKIDHCKQGREFKTMQSSKTWFYKNPLTKNNSFQKNYIERVEVQLAHVKL